MKKYIVRIITIFSLFFMLGMPVESPAQCPMCRMAADSNLENGGTAGKGLNAGILYMLSLPYVMVAGLGFWWYRNRKKEEDVDLQAELDAIVE